MAQTRPPPHRQLSRLHIPPPLDISTPGVPDNNPLYTSQPPTSAFHPVMSPQLFNGPGFQNGVIAPPNLALPPHLAHHRPRPSYVPANIPLPPTPSAAVPPNFPVPAPNIPNAGLQGIAPGRPFHPRRSASISIGGPPKAVLGGPRKPDPPLKSENESAVVTTNTAASSSQANDLAKPKLKKRIVKLPVETLPNIDGSESTTPSRPPWARYPIPIAPRQEDPALLPLEEITTAEEYPESLPRGAPLPPIGLLLPVKGAWEAFRNRIIEEKLAKLGVERGSQGVNPFIPGHTHARATSISSPADPALLLFKLNKLQQSQTQSILASPQSSDISLASAPGGASRHAYSKSMVPAPPSLDRDLGVPAHLKRSPLPSSSLHSVSETEDEAEDDDGDDEGEDEVSEDDEDRRDIPILAPQPKTPMQASMFQPEPPPRPDLKPDFTIGFGLDSLSEDESIPAAFGVPSQSQTQYALPPMDALDLTEFGRTLSGEASPAATDGNDNDSNYDESLTEGAFITPSHSRHASRVAVNHLHRETRSGSSLPHFITSQSDSHLVPRLDEEGSDEKENIPPSQEGSVWGDDRDQGVSTEDWTNPSLRLQRSVEEWRNPDNHENQLVTDTESTGEWSNPSDEERHRNERAERHLRKEALRAHHANQYGQPPSASIEDAFGVSHQRPRDISVDIISNPSDEGVHDQSAYFSAMEPVSFISASKSDDGNIRPSRPLPLPPKSEGHSFAPTPAVLDGHSRAGSAATAGPERLNPLAKPFIFGVQPSSGSDEPQADFSAQPQHVSHVRQGSTSRLNAAAIEFKPSLATFNFNPPPGVPSLSFAASIELQRPLPMPPSSPRAVQGREKRRRRGSGSGFGSGDAAQGEPRTQFLPHWEEDALGAKFDTTTVTLSEPTQSMSRRGSILNPAAKPFIFGRMSATLPTARRGDDTVAHGAYAAHGHTTPSSAPATIPASFKRSTDDLKEVTPRPLTDAPTTPIGSPDRSRRAPLPDFGHPVSTNTVPASVFKALAVTDGDQPTRSMVRSRISSRERLFDGHRPQASLDDINLPSIARRVQAVAASRRNEATRLGSPLFDVFTESPKGRSPHVGLESSADSNPRSGRLLSFHSSNHDELDVPSFDVEALTDRLGQVIDDKFLAFRRELTSRQSPIAPSEEVRKVLLEFIPVLESQVRSLLSEHRANAADDTADARGEIDYDMISSLIKQGHHDLRASLQRDITEVTQSLEPQPQLSHQTSQLVEELASRTIDAVNDNATRIMAHLHMKEQASHAESIEDNQESIIQGLLRHLEPRLESLRQEPFNLELTTSHLSQAVQPHISQLIDLASDKKETASLIAKELRPLFESLVPSMHNLEHGLQQMPSELSKIVPHLDVQSLMGAIAGSVLDRIDLRLSESEKSRASDNAPERLQSAATAFQSNSTNIITLLKDLASQNDDLLSKHTSLQSDHADLATKLSLLPSQLASASAAIAQAQQEIYSKAQLLTETKELQIAMEQNVALQQELAVSRNSLLDVERDKIGLRDSLAKAQAELTTSLVEVSELRKMQESHEEAIRQTKATASKHEDSLKFLGKDLEQTKAALREKEKEVKSLERKENDARGANEKLRGKLADTEAKLQVALNDVKHSKASADALLKESTTLVAQQSHWNDLKRTVEHVESLKNLLENRARLDAQEAQRFRDRTNSLEGELSALQKLHSEQEIKLGNMQRAAMGHKQSVANAQQRASEFEKKLKGCEQELQNCAFKLDQSEASRKETTDELEALKVQLQEYETNLQAGQERETRLQNQNATLEQETMELKAQLASAHAIPTTYPMPTSYLHSPASSTYSHNPSFINPLDTTSLVDYPSRPGTVTPEQSNGGQTPIESVWQSMHAPVEPPPTPRPKHQTIKRQFYVPPGSPTGSTASLAPTLGDDGWYS
ncbi:uncharacterized protein EI90DRAFT_3124518 [Cantharellus anzutake]|uniref:uncharacterized protein n=1 Tax=Cantharellus anzutake TaxID=1750568 RepID=UPI001904A234|nr:uncharacterized protein EI90DRAFT_3124518 [Cantharellus anzutake]KAF8330435.1 hypothetical protein EI90DRAFT_3124518 [Cantharellus anzutake]